MADNTNAAIQQDAFFQKLLGDVSTREFVDNFYLQQPFARQGGVRALLELGSWATVESILACEGVDGMLARQGQLLEGERLPDFATVRRLHDEGYTLVIRHAERHHGGLAELARGFQRDFLAPVNVHVYCTPDEQFGFGWHYDAEDVFILQTQGSKEYALRKNTVNPWPLVETIPSDMRFDCEVTPVMKCRLEAGDWLYIPAGYWHLGCSQEAAISLAVGVMSPSAMDVFDALRERLLSSLQWRQRLPVAGRAAARGPNEVTETYREIFDSLASDLQRQLREPSFAADFLRRRQCELGEMD